LTFIGLGEGKDRKTVVLTVLVTVWVLAAGEDRSLVGLDRLGSFMGLGEGKDRKTVLLTVWVTVWVLAAGDDRSLWGRDSLGRWALARVRTEKLWS
jgi:hypothetical protein